jgi:hypothetical protein
MKARVLAILLFIGLGFFLSGCDGSDSRSMEIVPLEAFHPSTIDTSNWMSKLMDRPLNQIVFPGSHDAGMSKADNCNPNIVKTQKMAKTQKWNIGQQLVAGSRYFDIRLQYDSKGLSTGHWTYSAGIWFGCDGELFEDIMMSTGKFLMEHPTEFVIFKFSHFRDKHGYNAVTAKNETFLAMEAWDAYFKMPENGGREVFYKNKALTVNNNLFDILWAHDVRGKILAVFDPPCLPWLDPSKGRFLYWDVGVGGAYWDTNFPVYDEYSDTANYYMMEEDQLKKWKKYGGFYKRHLFLLSWTLTPTSLSGGVESLANKANSHLPAVMLNDIWGKFPDPIKVFPNIVFIDFVDIGINQYIIQYNPDVRAVWTSP